MCRWLTALLLLVIRSKNESKEFILLSGKWTGRFLPVTLFAGDFFLNALIVANMLRVSKIDG